MQRWTRAGVAAPAVAPSNQTFHETPADESDLLDQATIEQLRSMDASGEDRIFRKVAGIFLETTPAQLDKLREHLAKADASGIALIAHGLKTGAANVAALSLSQSFRELEIAAREENLPSCNALAVEIFDLFEKVATALNEYTQPDQSVRESA
ncbi:MAG: Hpt domain-containing protein [Alphaproteobacteria bacterium]